MMNLEFERKLTIPKDVKEMYPVSAELSQIVAERAKTIEEIFTGKDRRLVLIIGPCSADNPDAVMDYLTRLRRVQEDVEKEIFIIPRVYTNKPRTTGDGYKGLLHQPDPQGKPDMFKELL